MRKKYKGAGLLAQAAPSESELKPKIEADAQPRDVHLALVLAGRVHVRLDNDLSAKNKASDANSHIGPWFFHPRLAPSDGVDHRGSAKAQVGRDSDGEVCKLVRFVAECDFFVAREAPQEAVAAPKCFKRPQNINSPDRIAPIAGIQPSRTLDVEVQASMRIAAGEVHRSKPPRESSHQPWARH